MVETNHISVLDNLVQIIKSMQMSHRYEVWIFMHHGAYRRVVLTDHGKVQEVNSAGDPVSESKNEEHPTDQAVKESPKISLQEVC